MNSSSLASASAAAVRPTFLTTLSHDPLSIVGGYLSREDQLTLREINDEVLMVVNNGVEAVAATPEALEADLESSAGLPDIEHIHLAHWHDDHLSALADVMQTTPHGHCQLALSRIPYLEHTRHSSADDVQHVATLRLASLSLSGVTIRDEYAMGSAEARFPVSIDLWAERGTRVCPATQIASREHPSLAAVSLFDDEIVALTEHPSLTSGVAPDAGTTAIESLLHNPRIESLSIGWNALQAPTLDNLLTLHPELRSLVMHDLARPAALIAIFQNTRITRLTLRSLSSTCYSSLANLAHMPSLRELTIGGHQALAPDNLPSLCRAQIAALCVRPLASLAFLEVDLSADAFEEIAATPCTTISIIGTIHEVTSKAIYRLIENQALMHLSLVLRGDWNHINLPNGGATLAGRSHLDTLRLDFRSLDERAEYIQHAWITSGKPLIDLTVTVRGSYTNASTSSRETGDIYMR